MEQGGVQKLEEVERRVKKNPTLFRKLDNEDFEQNECSYPYTKSRYKDVAFAKPLKKISFPTVAHSYSFWADLIFAPKSREEGMLLCEWWYALPLIACICCETGYLLFE